MQKFCKSCRGPCEPVCVVQRLCHVAESPNDAGIYSEPLYDPLLKEIETATHKVCSVKIYRGGKLAESPHALFLPSVVTAGYH